MILENLKLNNLNLRLFKHHSGWSDHQTVKQLKISFCLVTIIVIAHLQADLRYAQSSREIDALMVVGKNVS